MPVTASRVWRQLPNEIRINVSQIFWAESKGAEKQILIASLARAKNLREVFVRKSSMERLVNWTAATLALPDPILDELLKKYLLHEHRAVIVSFLDLLNIPHSEGMIEESFDYATLTNERVQEAARSLLASADRTGSELYLKYLVLQGGPWAGIEELLPGRRVKAAGNMAFAFVEGGEDRIHFNSNSVYAFSAATSRLSASIRSSSSAWRLSAADGSKASTIKRAIRLQLAAAHLVKSSKPWR